MTDSHTNGEGFCVSYGTWVDCVGGEIPEGAVKGGYEYIGVLEVESDKRITYVGRGMCNGRLVPGKVAPWQGGCYVAYDDNEYFLKHYQVLVNREYKEYSWVTEKNGNILSGAVLGGFDGDTKMFIGRSMYRGELQKVLVLGNIHPNKRNCCFTLYGNEYKSKEFQILVQSHAEDQKFVPIARSKGMMLFAEAVHSDDFSKFDNEYEYKIVTQMIAALNFTGTNGKESGIVMTTKDVQPCVEESLRRRIDATPQLQSIRLEVSRKEVKEKTYERYVIKSGDRSVTVVHIQVGADFAGVGGTKSIKRAFWQSINEEADIFLNDPNQNLSESTKAILTWTAYKGKHLENGET